MIKTPLNVHPMFNDEPDLSPKGDIIGNGDSDLEQRSRNIYLFKEFDAKTSQLAISNLLALEEENPEKDIFLYINSYGGSVIDLLAIIDCIDNLACDVWTIGIGVCASSGAVLLASGTPGKRYCYEHTRILLHEVSNTVKGTVSDLDIRIQEILNNYATKAQDNIAQLQLNEQSKFIFQDLLNFNLTRKK
jgi:ATP-dependent Clp endopeptidase proteolytic subunit ClpP